MYKTILTYFLFFVVYLTPAYVLAQVKTPKPKPETTQMKLDSTQLTPKTFDKQAISDYKTQPDFQYDEVGERQLSLWERFWIGFWNWVRRIFSGAATNSISRYFFIGLAVAIVLFLVIKIVGAQNIFRRDPPESALPYDVLNDNIHEIDYETEIQRLVSEGKYRLAVRLLYLRTLKKLSDAQIIEWQPDKTNYNYLMEITRPALKGDFGQLTLQFDYIWYGDFPIDEHKFEPIKQSFNHFNKQINERI
ncbi:DUF4129 domain-containing protein [Pedobacter sandarakinus]|uniref:DUF4129 domain-containing protein n=1 Tax=Pedobacter sandarakinus TaxID=353156 RepID=UPI0022474B60|nr:DUF4129 domain-containing protein [Pedobacter sandarakinus]MCX2573469.1 DUF4129 domain-containing protein [Pedobacter sandarakinus]